LDNNLQLTLRDSVEQHELSKTTLPGAQQIHLHSLFLPGQQVLSGKSIFIKQHPALLVEKSPGFTAFWLKYGHGQHFQK
jgi:hypothetical protein